MKKENTFRIRAAVSADIIRLLEMNHTVDSDYVWQLDFRKEQGEINVNLRTVRLPRSVRVPYPRNHLLLPELWKKDSFTYVAVSEGVPIGYIRFLAQELAGVVWVQDLVISTEARKKQAATALIRFTENWALERRYRKVFIEMSSKNHPAISLAQKEGFEFSGYNEHYYATQDIALFFGKQL